MSVSTQPVLLFTVPVPKLNVILKKKQFLLKGQRVCTPPLDAPGRRHCWDCSTVNLSVLVQLHAEENANWPPPPPALLHHCSVLIYFQTQYVQLPLQ